MILDWLVMLSLGRLVIWTVQTSGLTRWIWKLHPILAELGECDYCLGFWVYLVLNFWFQIDVFEMYTPVASEIANAVLASMIVHLVRLGWTMKFGVLDLTES